MEFLKEILGEELFNQFKEKIDAFNGDEANKDKQVKIANLSGGEYVGKGKFDSLQEALNGKDTELANANNLIAELKKASKGNEEIQSKFTQYEQDNARLQAELQETKLKSAIKVALLSEHATDVDYLTFKMNEKLKEKGETLELDENENIKGWEDRISGLKTQFPTFFSSPSGKDEKKIEENRLPERENDGNNAPVTLADALKERYEQKG